MTTPVLNNLDFGNTNRINGLPQANANGQPVTFEQLNAAIEGLSWKDSVRTASSANVNIASPGASIAGVTMAANDRVLLKDQTAPAENGLYIWNGAAVAMTRALDASTYDELEGARVRVEEGTNANTEWTQTGVNGTLGSTAVTWTSGGTGAPPASETTAGIAELATQVETDAGTDDQRIVTPFKLANSPFRRRAFAATFGDGSATSYPINHNLNTEDVDVQVYETGGQKRNVWCTIRRTSVNQVTLDFGAAVALNSLRAVIQA